MRAVLQDDTGVSLTDANAPACDEGSVLVRPSLVVLSALDASVLARPRTPGAAFVGVREADGARVVASPDLICGACDRCRSGLGAHCENRVTLGDSLGALAEQIALPSRQLAEVPEHVPDDAAAVSALAAVAVQAAGRLHVRQSPYATVIGAGAGAILTAQALARTSATVRVLSSNARTLDACAQRGLRARPIDEAGRRGDQDTVVVCAGEPGAAEVALAMASPRGRVVLTPGSGAPASLELISSRELDVLGSRWAPIGEALGAISRGDLDTQGLITKRFKLDRAADALSAAASGDELAVAVSLS